MPLLGLLGESKLQARFFKELISNQGVEVREKFFYESTSLSDFAKKGMEEIGNEDYLLEEAENYWLKQPSSRFLVLCIPDESLSNNVRHKLLEMFAKRPLFSLVYLVHKNKQFHLDYFEKATFTVVFDIEDDEQKILKKLLDTLQLTNKSWFRPDWDAYFMEMAKLASLRSNCNKRRVGSVLVRTEDCTVVSTGYNGTPRGLRNCQDGGCPRCHGPSKCGIDLSTCLCLHAEENALLEAGRSRAYGGTLYCTTAPCLQCCKKIVQSGVKRVIYAWEYSVEHDSRRVLEEAGIRLNKFCYPQRIYYLSQFISRDEDDDKTSKRSTKEVVQQAVRDSGTPLRRGILFRNDNMSPSPNEVGDDEETLNHLVSQVVVQDVFQEEIHI